jgi:hypothetical protein
MHANEPPSPLLVPPPKRTLYLRADIVLFDFRRLAILCRCRVIPFVSQEFRSIHKEYPPQRKRLDIDKPITSGLVERFLSISASLEVLTVNASEEIPGLLPQASLSWVYRSKTKGDGDEWVVSDCTLS